MGAAPIEQPPLSQQIRALEDELGFRLFDRRPKGVETTAAGLVFLEEARALLAGVRRASERAALVAAGFGGSLSVGFTSSAAAHGAAPLAIAAFRREFPNIHLTFEEGNASTLTQAVLRSTLDVALVRAPVTESSDVRYDRLSDEPMLVAFSSTHPLAQGAERQRGITLRALASESFIMVRRPGAPGMYANLIAACRLAGFTPRIAYEVGGHADEPVACRIGYRRDRSSGVDAGNTQEARYVPAASWSAMTDRADDVRIASRRAQPGCRLVPGRLQRVLSHAQRKAIIGRDAHAGDRRHHRRAALV